MFSDNLIINGFEPVRMIVENIGPFRDPFELDFTDSDEDPCNYFLLISENGKGKTTLLDIMTVLVSMLNAENPDFFGHDDLDEVVPGNSSRAQLDILVSYRDDDYRKCILSLIAGPEGSFSVRPVTDSELQKRGAEAWYRFGYRRHATGRMEEVGKREGFLGELLSLIKREMNEVPNDFGESSLTVPTILYFTANRDIPKIIGSERSITQPENWSYKVVKRFISRNDWTHSIDNLLVWFKWLDDGRFERAIDDVNRFVFRDTAKRIEGIQKDPPEAIVSNRGSRHRLDRLSSGEKSLIQLILRIGAHMTGNTWLLIDEMDIHLHPKWQHRILNILKDMVAETPGLRVIATTHSREILKGFQFEIKENGLRKGGHIIEENL